jgi:hypothetical protein
MAKFLSTICFSSIILFLIPLASGAAPAESSGTIIGHVIGLDGEAIPGVRLLLHNDITGYRSEAVSGPDGSFRFYNIPFNPYHLHADLEGFTPFLVIVNVRSAAPSDVTVKLKPAEISMTVVVTSGEPAAGQLETDTSTSHVDIDKSYIARAPAAVSSRAMEELITATPGFAKDENGRFHFQGAHSQSEYVIDGQTISDQAGVTFSNSIDPGIAQSMEVIYGNVPAEYGEKVGTVVNLATKSGLGSPFKADIQSGMGSFGTFEEGASVMGGSQTWGVFASVTGSRSARFLDPVNPGNLHNVGHTERAFLRLDYATPKMTDILRFTLLAGRTDRDVPNTTTQEAAGQDESVKSHDENLNLGWTHVLSSTATFDLNAFARFSEFRLFPSPNDIPVLAESGRSLDNYGLAPSFTWVHGAHEVKVGAVFKRFPIDEHFSFGITDPALNDPASADYNPDLAPYDLTRGGSLFDFNGQRAGAYYAAYVQDNVKLQDLTLNVGFRYDRNDLPMSQSALEPRLGAAYFIRKTGTVLRASYNRVFYTPEYENILLSSSPEAASLVPPLVQQSRELGGGLLLVPGERQNAYTVGVQQALGGHARLDADFWWRRSKGAGDQDQFENTGIVFPIAFSSGRYDGWDVRLDLARTHGFQGFLSLGHTHAVYVPPNTGGLFLDQAAIETITAGPFLIDHDQAIQAQLAVLYDIGRSGFWAGVNVRYDSGLVCDVGPADIASDPDNAFAAPYIVVHSGTGLDPNRIAARMVANFSVGADLSPHGIPLTIQADLLNAFNKQGVYNIESVFGGTHVIPPRTFAVHLRYSFGGEKKKGRTYRR